MQFANYHAHSHFSDGQESPESYLKNAIRQGLIAYGFSDHAPIPIPNFGAMQLDQLSDYLSAIDTLKEKYGERIQVYKSLEVDYIPDIINIQSSHIQTAALDYTIGAVHFIDKKEGGIPWGFEGSAENFDKGLQEVFNGNILNCVSRYYQLIREMVTDYCPNIVAHLDRIKKQNQDEQYFSEREQWYQSEVIKTLEVIRQSDVILEINTKGYYKGEIEDMYPSKWILDTAHEMGIPFIIGSDAHHPDDITKGFKYAVRLLRSMGVKTTKIFIDNEWQEVTIKRPRLHLVS